MLTSRKQMPTDAAFLAALEANEYGRNATAVELGVCIDWVRRTISRMEAAGRVFPFDPQAHNPGGYLPTEEEIAAECAKIRARWSANDFERRNCHKPRPVDVYRACWDSHRAYKHYSDTEFSGVISSAG